MRFLRFPLEKSGADRQPRLQHAVARDPLQESRVGHFPRARYDQPDLPARRRAGHLSAAENRRAHDPAAFRRPLLGTKIKKPGRPRRGRPGLLYVERDVEARAIFS